MQYVKVTKLGLKYHKKGLRGSTVIHGKKPSQMLDASARFSFHVKLSAGAHWPVIKMPVRRSNLPARLHSFPGLGHHRIRQHSALPTITIRRPARSYYQLRRLGAIPQIVQHSLPIPVGDVAFSNHYLGSDPGIPIAGSVTRFEKFPSEPVEHFFVNQPADRPCIRPPIRRRVCFQGSPDMPLFLRCIHALPGADFSSNRSARTTLLPLSNNGL